ETVDRLADIFVPDNVMSGLGRPFLAHANGHDHIEVAVAIEVHGVPVNRRPRSVVDDVLLPGPRRGLAGVLVPDDTGAVNFSVRYVQRDVRVAEGCAKQIDLAVAVEVPRPYRPRLGHLVVDDV